MRQQAFDPCGSWLPPAGLARGLPVLALLLPLGAAEAGVLMTDTGWSESGNAAFARFGEAVAPAGDVNGDGLSDVLVGAPQEASLAGRAYVFHGGVYPPLSGSPDWTGMNGLAGSQYGYSVASAGDVNGDGYDDVLVGAPYTSSDNGRAYLYLGSATGLSATPAWEVNGSTDARYGFSVATAGDVNGDGYADVLVGSPDFGLSFGDVGRVNLYLGSAAGLSTSSWSTGGPTSSDFGYSVSTCGDVNADGYADFLAGDPGYNAGTLTPDAGRVQLFLGNAAGTPTTGAWSLIGPASNARYGAVVSLAGDLNGDGYADAAIGAPDYPLSTMAGRVIVCYGTSTGLTNTGSVTLDGASGDELGTSVAPAGDLDGNGFADLVVGVPLYSSINAGRIAVYAGSAAGISTTPSWALDGTQNSAALGHSVATSGDVDGDGFSELLVSEYAYDAGATTNAGRVRLFGGGTEGLAASGGFVSFGDQSDEQYGTALAGAGDVNGDGYEDLIVGSPFFNGASGTEAGRVELVYGSYLGLQIIPTPWNREGSAVYDWFGASVAQAGDVNGDGYGDIAVGAPGDNALGTNSGRAYVFHGSASGPGSIPSWSTGVGEPSSFIGNAVASAGDVNGDGYGDVIVGAKDYGSSQSGIAYCYLGSPAGLASTPVWSALGPHPGSQFGHAVTACDKDGDGYSDLFVGAPSFDDAATDEGLVLGYRGGPSGPEATPAWEFQGSDVTPSPTGVQLGYALASIATPSGHVDGLAIGAPWLTAGFSQEGMVLIHLPGWARSVYGGQTGANFGFSLADARDTNGDGLGDIVVGAPRHTNTQTQEGRWCVVQVTSSTTWCSYAGQANAHGGWAVAAGDFNGDGFSDPAGSAVDYANSGVPLGRVWSYPGGGSSQLSQVPFAPRIVTSTGTPIARLGVTDLADQVRIRTERAQSPAGRTPIRQDWWLFPTLDRPYPVDLAITPSSGWVDTGPVAGLGSATTLVDPISGLLPSTPYTVQWRLRTPSPHFPASRWFRVGAAGRTQVHFRTAEPLLAAEGPEVSSPISLAAFPNPFAAGTRLRFDVPAAGAVRVRVYDLAGRIVRSLEDQVLAAGPHEAAWDGRDARGESVAAGVYLARVEVPGATAVRRLVLAR